MLAALGVWGLLAPNADANAVVVSHDINTLASFVAGAQESTFAVNVATFLTSGDATKNLLLFESNPGNGTRNFAPAVLNALTGAGFNVTVTANYATPFAGFDALFVAQDFPTVGFLDNAALISYVNSGGSVYLAGGVGPSPVGEAAGWNTFLNHYGLAFASVYNDFTSVGITSTHPIFAGVTALGSGIGQSIIDLGINPNAQVVQTKLGQNVYAVVSIPVPEPQVYALLLIGLGFVGLVVRRRAQTGTAR